MQLYWAAETEKDDASSIASSAGLEGLKPMSKDELIHERFMTKPNEAQLVSCLLFLFAQFIVSYFASLFDSC